ncbi:MULTISPECIES: cupin domain-containing protein [Nostoc]|uniref:Cupin domain-containing protein n=1 Tax=Nostoc paludosum FACHB-159 TaxID=2692908 RepID=A0ABR8K5D0_9NOSO|nr:MULTISPECIES: cupin domain-containing protein [Nostoc]MBD2678583.1 cupin domain-containing protein [Nostoc sp. FACHB-857]MBD2734630.1 cupin domain-containing protein [Nostoc paludosum FACHB-159]
MTFNIQASLVQPGKGSTYLVLGDFYTLLAEGKDTDGKYGLVEALMQPQSTVPSHIHDGDEAHYILEGEVEYQLDEQTIIASAGTFLNIPKGQWHGFKNIGSKPVKLLMWVTPAGGEQFFAEVGHPVNLPLSEEERSLFGTVNPADIEKAIALAVTKYGLEFKLPAAENS